MILLDTDILTLFAAGNPRITKRVVAATELVATTIITKIEVLRGRFDALLKAANGQQLQLAYERLVASEQDLEKFTVIPVDATS